MKIIADSREPAKSILSGLKGAGMEIEMRELSSGDYLLNEETGVAVERKAAADFILSIMDRRLFAQVAKMKLDYAHPIILIEGEVFETRSAINHDAIRGAISWLAVIERITVHHTRNAGDTVSMLCMMVKHATDGLGYVPPLRSNKPKDLSALAQFLVEGLPGCGAATARNLLSHFGSAEAVFLASEDDLIKVPGVGKKAAAKFREALSASVGFD